MIKNKTLEQPITEGKVRLKVIHGVNKPDNVELSEWANRIYTEAIPLNEDDKFKTYLDLHYKRIYNSDDVDKMSLVYIEEGEEPYILTSLVRPEVVKDFHDKHGINILPSMCDALVEHLDQILSRRNENGATK